MHRYAANLSDISPTILGVHRAADIVAALAPPAAGTTAIVPAAPAVPQESVVKKVLRFAPGAAGAAAGFAAWKNHRILGAVAGHALVNSGWEFYKGDKKKALCNAAVEGTGIAGAMFFHKSPVIGFVGGALAAAVATYFVPGSPVRQQVERFRK